MKRSVPKQMPPMTAEGLPGPQQTATSDDMRRIAKRRRPKPRGKPSKPQPMSTDVSELFKEK